MWGWGMSPEGAGPCPPGAGPWMGGAWMGKCGKKGQNKEDAEKEQQKEPEPQPSPSNSGMETEVPKTTEVPKPAEQRAPSPVQMVSALILSEFYLNGTKIVSLLNVLIRHRKETFNIYVYIYM